MHRCSACCPPFVPALMHWKLILPGNVQYIWTGINIVFALLGLVTGILCVQRPESRNPINVIAVVISLLLVLIMTGIFILYLIGQALIWW